MDLDDLDFGRDDVDKWKRTIKVGQCNIYDMTEDDEKIQFRVCHISEGELDIRAVEFDDDGKTIFEERRYRYREGIPIEKIEG